MLTYTNMVCIRRERDRESKDQVRDTHAQNHEPTQTQVTHGRTCPSHPHTQTHTHDEWQNVPFKPAHTHTHTHDTWQNVPFVPSDALKFNRDSNKKLENAGIPYPFLLPFPYYPKLRLTMPTIPPNDYRPIYYDRRACRHTM